MNEVVLLVNVLIFLLGLIFLLIGYRQRKRWKRLKETTGLIVKKEKTITINLTTLFQSVIQSETDKEKERERQEQVPDEYPTFQYSVDGKRYERRSRLSIKPGFKPGTEVPVYYDPEQPRKAYLKTIANTGTFFICAGVGVFLVNLLLMVLDHYVF